MCFVEEVFSLHISVMYYINPYTVCEVDDSLKLLFRLLVPTFIFPLLSSFFVLITVASGEQEGSEVW